MFTTPCKNKAFILIIRGTWNETKKKKIIAFSMKREGGEEKDSHLVIFEKCIEKDLDYAFATQ